MTHQEIVTQLSLKYSSEDIIFSISMADLLSALARRYVIKALDLSDEDLELAREEVKAAIEHHLDEREYIAIGLDSQQPLL